jgi:septation ring formation regulator EzrA
MKGKEKEQEDYEKVKQEYEKARRNVTQTMEYYGDQFLFIAKGYGLPKNLWKQCK